MRITTNDGVELAVEATGSGPALLLLHGLGGAKEDFADHVPVLARDERVVIYDHRGHGASDNPADPAAYSADRLAADALEVADALGIDRFRLLGHSMGGMIARRVALRAPDRVEALVMMDTAAGPVPGFDPELIDLAADVALTQGKAALKELLDFTAPLETDAYRRVRDGRPGYVEFEARKWEGMSEVMWGVLVREFAYEHDDLEALAGLRCPLLVLVGEQDEPFLAASRMIADAVPAAELVVIPAAGHSPQFENPDAWIGAMTSFLSSLPAPAR